MMMRKKNFQRPRVLEREVLNERESGSFKDEGGRRKAVNIANK